MISIIVSSQNPILFNQLADNIEKTIGVEHEIICIKNEGLMGICEAYNLGASRAKFKYLVFCHEDILYHTQNWGKILIENFNNSNANLIGVLGSVFVSKHPSNIYIHKSGFNRQQQLQRIGKEVINCYENPLNETYSKVAVVDGFFMATKKEIWQKTKFSENYLIGFHGYDKDFSLKCASLGQIVVVYNILIEHFSYGNFDRNWINAQLLLAKKWNKKYPSSTRNASKAILKKFDNLALAEYISFAITNKIRSLKTYNYFIKHLFCSPFHRKNFFFIRRMLLGEKIDTKLKKYLTN